MVVALLCASGCNGRLNQPGILTVSAVYSLLSVSLVCLDLDHGFYKSGTTKTESSATTTTSVSISNVAPLIPLVVVCELAMFLETTPPL